MRANKRSAGREIEENAFISLKNAIRGARDPRAQVSQARDSIPPERFAGLIAWLRSNRLVARYVFSPEFPKNYRQLLSLVAPLERTTLTREFRWAIAYLQPRCELLRYFVTKAQAFQRAYLTDSYEAGTLILDEVEKQFGQSFWLIKHRIQLLQASAGLEAQKQYAERLWHVDQPGPPEAIAYFVSMRNEPSVTPNRFYSQSTKNIKDFNLPPAWEAYLRYHIIPETSYSSDTIADILRIESSGAVIDYYETLVCLAQALALRRPEEIVSSLAPTFSLLYKGVGDTRLGGLLAGIGITPSPELPSALPESVKAAEALIFGDYPAAAALAASALINDPADPDAIAISARAAAMERSRVERSERPLVQRLITKLAGVISKGSSATDDVVEVARRAINSHGEPWANALLGQLEREISNSPDVVVGRSAHLAAMGGGALHPFRVMSLPPGLVRTHYARLVNHRFGESPVSAYSLAMADGARVAELPDSIIGEERTLLRAMHALANAEMDVALDAASLLADSPHDFYKRRAVRILCRALLSMGRMDDCIERLTGAYVQERALYDVLPIAGAVDALRTTERRPLVSSISVPILFDMHTRYIDQKDDSECMFSFLDFLDAHEIQRPSALGAIRDRFDREKLVYFLRYVCVESIMDRSGIFSSSRELLEERLGICRLLIDLDESDVKSYQTEIKALLRRLMLQKRMQEVEQSKIYVDTDSIKRTLAEELRETFNRYVALKRERTDVSSSMEILSALRKSDGNLHELVNLVLPKNETSELFESMIKRLRDEYALSPEHGLDKYLSVRIRHGTLAAHLRKPVDAAKLITPRDLGSSAYKRNEYWPGRLRIPDPQVRQQLADRLAAFSLEFDQLVDEVKSWIQVRTTLNERGMFDFSLTEPQLRVLAEYVTQEITFDQFVDFIVGHFGEMLDKRLQFLRARIIGSAKVRASDLLDTLEADIEQLGALTDTREMANAIRTAKTELQVAFDRVSTWFRRANATANEPIPLADALDISIETVRAVAPRFTAEVRAPEEDSVVIPGSLLAIFTDIFFIIFENIVRHASLNAPVANISLESGDKAILIQVENELGSGVDTADAKARIAAIKSDMRDGRHVASVSREGGTGFHKLGKLLAHDLGVKPELDFDFSDNGRFYVRFKVPVSKYQEVVK